MASSIRLPLSFAANRLADDLAQITPEEWTPHYNPNDYEGEWTGVALRSVGGAAASLYADPSPQAVFADTPVLDRCPYLREVLAQFPCPLRSVRLLRLRPGARIREHRDPGLGRGDREVRIHVPVATNAEVDFVVAGRRMAMQVGEAWFIDFTQPHRVANRGTTDRVHLVLDCVVNDGLRDLLTAGDESDAGAADTPASPPDASAFERFRAGVLEDPALQDVLCEITDRALFVERVVQLGAERGERFSPGDVEEALRAGRRSWLERWIV